MEIRSLFRSLIWSGRISDYYIYLQIIQINCAFIQENKLKKSGSVDSGIDF